MIYRVMGKTIYGLGICLTTLALVSELNGSPMSPVGALLAILFIPLGAWIQEMK